MLNLCVIELDVRLCVWQAVGVGLADGLFRVLDALKNLQGPEDKS